MALTLSLLVPWPLLAMTETSAPRIFLIQLICAVLLLSSLLWYGRGGRFVPGLVKRRRAHDVALREFTARGLSRTRQRTGVLLYVAIQERYAEIIVDSGIDGRVDQAVWDDIVEAVVVAGRAGQLREGIVTAVRAIGAVLANHAPPRPDDTNELPNNVLML